MEATTLGIGYRTSQCERTGLAGLKSEFQVGDQIAEVLDADRQAEQSVPHSRLRSGGRGEPATEGC